MPSRPPSRALTAALLLLIGLARLGGSPPAAAQSAAATAPAGQLAGARPLTSAEERQRAALARVAAGDLAGAIEVLAAARREGTATPPELALLGALYLESGSAAEARRVLQPLAAGENPDPAVLYNAGRAALAEGDTAAGRQLLERAVAVVPLSPAGRELGLLLARQGDVVGGYRLLRPWSLRSPGDVEARVTAASLALRLERPAEAEELVATLPADDPAARLLRGRARVLSGDAEGALRQLAPLRAAHPPGLELEVAAALAEAHLLAGQSGAARELLAGKTAGRPALAVLLARAQRAGGDVAGARATLAPFVSQLPAEAAAVGDPRVPAAVAAEYGQTLLAAGDTAGGTRHLEQSTRLYSASRAAWEALAAALAGAGRSAEAAAARARAGELQRAEAARRNATPPPLQVPPGEVRPGLAEAQALMAEGKSQEALARVQRQLAEAPGDLEGRVLETRLLLQQGRWSEALAASEAALQLDAGNPNLRYLHGAVLISLQRLPEAEHELRATLAVAPDHLGALNDLAVVLAAQQRLEEARGLLQRVVRINPTDSTARASLEQIEKLIAQKSAG